MRGDSLEQSPAHPNRSELTRFVTSQAFTIDDEWWIPARGGCKATWTDCQSTHRRTFGGGKMKTFKLGKRMTPAELLLAYKTALEAIAKGNADAANIAQEAVKL